MNTSFWVKAKPTASALLRPRPTESDAPSTVRPALSASHVYSSLSKVWFHLGCLQMSTRNCPSNHSRDRHPISTAIRRQTMLPMMSAQAGRTTYTVDDAGCHKCTEADTKQPVNGHCPHRPDSQTGLLSSCQPCNLDSALSWLHTWTTQDALKWLSTLSFAFLSSFHPPLHSPATGDSFLPLPSSLTHGSLLAPAWPDLRSRGRNESCRQVQEQWVWSRESCPIQKINKITVIVFQRLLCAGDFL